MTDRVIVYDGALPQTTDILQTNKFAMVSLAFQAAAALGTNTVVSGLACTQSSPTTNLFVNIAPGSIYSLIEVDATAYGDLGVDTATIVKQGILYSAQSLQITPPTTVGYSQVFLVQAEYVDQDSGSAVLPYLNANNPAQPFTGPANSGSTSQFTIRQGLCNISLVAGVALPTGTQTTPAPLFGNVGLFAVTVANGQTQITNSNIATLTTAPFFPPLPQIPPGVQTNAWTYAPDTSAGGVPPTTTSSTSTSSAILHFSGGVPAYIATGMAAFDLTTPAAIAGGQTVLSVGATSVTLTGNVNATVNSSDIIAFSNNAMVTTVWPIPSMLVPGLVVQVKVAGTNSGACTLNVNGLGAVAVHRATGAVLAAGDLSVGQVAAFMYDGTAWQVINFTGATSSTITNNFNSYVIPYAVAGGTANALTATFSPVVSSLTAGLIVLVQAIAANTGATTLAPNGLATTNILENGLALLPNAIVNNELLVLCYDGASFQKLNCRNQVFSFNSSSPPASDIPMQVGDILTVTFTSVTSVPLKVATVQGVYEIEWCCTNSPNCQDGDPYLLPNNATNPGGMFTTWLTQNLNQGGAALYGYPIAESWNSGQYPTLTNFNFDLIESAGNTNTAPSWNQPPLLVKMTCSTFTAAKMVRYYGGCQGGPSAGFCIWGDTSTGWTSLGSLVLTMNGTGSANATVSGTAIVRRLA